MPWRPRAARTVDGEDVPPGAAVHRIGSDAGLPIADPMLSSTKLHVLGNASDPLPDYVAGFVEHLRLRMS